MGFWSEVIYIFHGEDTYSLFKETASLEQKFGTGFSEAGDVIRLDLREESFEHLQNAIATLPFFGGTRLLILRNFFEKYSPKAGSKVTNKAHKTDANPNAVQHVKQLLISKPEFTTVIIESPVSQLKNSLLEEFTAIATIKHFPKLTESELQRWVVNYVNQRGGRIAHDAAAALSSMVGVDLWRLSNELDKLILLREDEIIDATSIKEAVVFTRDVNIFTILDAFFATDFLKAIRLLNEMMGTGSNYSYVLSMISRQVRLLLLAKEASSLSMGLGETRSHLGVNNDFVLKKTLKQAQGYSESDLVAFYGKLRDFDLAVKTGRFDPLLGLNIIFGAGITSQRTTG